MKIQQFKKLLTQGALACILLAISPAYAQQTYTVTTTADTVPATTSSLRWAIQQVNAGAGLGDTIAFGIPTSDPGYDPATNTWSIVPVQDLDTITQKVTIDGYTQSGASANTLDVGSNAVLTIILNGNNYMTGDGNRTGNGLHFAPLSDTSVDGSIMRGLVINQWIDNGILLDTTNNNITGVSIVGNFMGTDASGIQQMANRNAIGLAGLKGNQCISTMIGTTAAADRNILAGSFSGNVIDFYGLEGGCISSNRSLNTAIQNNYIGTDKTGTKSLGNMTHGLQLRRDLGDIVSGNLISGSTVNGVYLTGSGNTLIEGNYIGVDITGTYALGNANSGIRTRSALPANATSGATIVGNLISGNGAGIHIGDPAAPGSILNAVQGNFIGTNKKGTHAIPNTRWGIELADSENTIGGSELNQANFISGNLKGGILVYSNNATANVISNNLVGTDSTGLFPLPNNKNGIQIGLNGGLGGSFGNLIGDPSSQSVLEKRPLGLNANERPRRSRKRHKLNGASGSLPSRIVFSKPEIDEATKQMLSQPAQTIGLNFTAATISDVLDANAVLPNQNGWVGPQQYILMTYGIIRSFNKTTGQPDGALDIDAASFFGLGIHSDVRINYSRFLDRWIFSCESNADSELEVAWSDSGVITPETVWTFNTFSNAALVPQIDPTDAPADLDYQQLATDANAVYISVDAIDEVAGIFLGTSTLIIPNSSITKGNTSPAFTVIPGILVNISEFTPPADNFDPDATFGYLVNAVGFEYPCLTNVVPFCPPPSTPTECCTYNQLFFYRILNPGSAQATLGQQILLDVPNYTDPANAPHKGNLYTLELPPGNVNAMYLQTGFSKLMAPHVRNKQLYVCHPIQVDNTGAGNPAGDRVGVRWYQFDLTGDPTGNGCGIETETTCPALVQWGTVYDPHVTDNPKFYYIPSIMTNKNGDLVIEGTVSGNDDYTNVFYAGRKATDPLGITRDPVLITNNTSNPFNSGPFNNFNDANIGQRWGDESSLAPDPSNDIAIWSTGQWAAVVNGYGTQATQLLPAQ